MTEIQEGSKVGDAEVSELLTLVAQGLNQVGGKDGYDWAFSALREMESRLSAAQETLTTSVRALQFEMDSARRERDKALKDVRFVSRQLEAVDENLPPWESATGEHAVGRVQTILNLRRDRMRLEGLEETRAALSSEDATRPTPECTCRYGNTDFSQAVSMVEDCPAHRATRPTGDKE